MRSLFVFLAAALMAGTAANAQMVSCATPGNDNAFLNIQTIRLWPGDAPQAKGATCDDIPALTVLSPRPGPPHSDQAENDRAPASVTDRR